MTDATRKPLRDWSDFKMLDQIMAYEAGDLVDEEIVTLFQHLVDTGHAWTLQGTYGRTAQALIEAGVVAPDAFTEPEREYDEE